MLNIICPTCGTMLDQLAYEKDIKTIMDNSKLSDDQKEEEKKKIIKKYTRRYCCASRLMTYINMAEIYI